MDVLWCASGISAQKCGATADNVKNSIVTKVCLHFFNYMIFGCSWTSLEMHQVKLNVDFGYSPTQNI